MYNQSDAQRAAELEIRCRQLTRENDTLRAELEKQISRAQKAEKLPHDLPQWVVSS